MRYRKNRETARYFERECGIARQFGVWSAQNSEKSNYHENRRRAELLESRREKLRNLLKSEDRDYEIECERLSRQRPRVSLSSSSFNETKIREKRAEDSLYRPLNCRRIQSYFTENLTRNIANSRRILKVVNIRKSRMDESSKNDHFRDNEVSNYDDRMEEYKENSRIAKASSLYGGEIDYDEKKNRGTEKSPQMAPPVTSAEPRPRTRSLHDSHFHLSGEENFDEPRPISVKFQDRYAHKSLEGTCVVEKGFFDEIPEEKVEAKDEDSRDESDRVEEKIEEIDDEIEKNDEKIEQSPDSPQDHQDRTDIMIQDEKDRQFEIDREVGAKANAGRSDHRHFETEKSFPWMRMIPGDKNLSEQMFLYLTHNELKARIQDLDKREQQACSKHQWDEALRLRDMKNRLDLARERNLYRRDDLTIDPEVKKLGQAGIEAREKLLKQREISCTNSAMYSEEAKIMWDQWVIEDEKSILQDARLLREDLMNQLEENWRSLALEDKQKITDTFKDKDIVNYALQRDNDNSSIFRVSGR